MKISINFSMQLYTFISFISLKPYLSLEYVDLVWVFMVLEDYSFVLNRIFFRVFIPKYPCVNHLTTRKHKIGLLHIGSKTSSNPRLHTFSVNHGGSFVYSEASKNFIMLYIYQCKLVYMQFLLVMYTVFFSCLAC